MALAMRRIFPRGIGGAALNKARACRPPQQNKSNRPHSRAAKWPRAFLRKSRRKTRWILEVQHGADNFEGQLAAWEQLQAQQEKTDKQNARAAQ